MKIAFATSDRVNVNAHFGWAQEIDIYEISDQGYEFIETLNFNVEEKKGERSSNSEATSKKNDHDCKKAKKAETPKSQDKDGESDDKIAKKLAALSDCKIVYIASIGGTAAAKLIKKGVMPIKPRPEQEDIVYLLNRLVQTLKGNPPPWLRKALQQNKSGIV